MKTKQVTELLLQSLEQEIGGVQVYETAIKCAINKDLAEEWNKYLDQTRTHVETLTDIFDKFGIPVEQDSPGRQIVRSLGEALVGAMNQALAAGDPAAAQLVACECVVLAETKDHLDWELIGKCSERMTGDKGKDLKAAYDKVEDEEDEHLYHTRGWCRELWLQSLGIDAVLPPPEEEKDVKTAIGAARAEKAADAARK